MNYQVVTDAELNDMFERGSWSKGLDKREQLLKSVLAKHNGYWVGSTMFHIMVDHGLIKDGKPCGCIELTKRGIDFLKQELGVDQLPPSKGRNRHD